jgi:hypothetical protein
METYETANYVLKVNYPRIIVDVVAVLNRGIDMSGKQVSVHRICDYYLSRKSEPLNNITGVHVSNIISDEDKERDIGKNNLIQRQD